MAKKAKPQSPPFMVQAERVGKQHGVNFVTDTRHEDLPGAIAAATKLHTDWGRRVRVQDQEARIHFRLPDMYCKGATS